MIPKDILIGILFGSCQNSINILSRNACKFGYQVRVFSSIRGSIDLLEPIQRTLLQFEINSTLRKEESKSYPKPVLKITGLNQVKALSDLINKEIERGKLPPLMKWTAFEKCIEIIEDKKHYTSQGFKSIIANKELMN